MRLLGALLAAAGAGRWGCRGLGGAVGTMLCSGTLGCPDSDPQHWGSGAAPRWPGSAGRQSWQRWQQEEGMGLPGTRALLLPCCSKRFSSLFFFSSLLSKAAEKRQKEPAMAEEGRERSGAAQHPGLASPGPAAAAGLCAARKGRGPVSPRRFFKLSECLSSQPEPGQPAGAFPAAPTSRVMLIPPDCAVSAISTLP